MAKEPMLPTGLGKGVSNVDGPYEEVPINHPAHPDRLRSSTTRSPRSPQDIIDSPNGEDGDPPTIYGR